MRKLRRKTATRLKVFSRNALPSTNLATRGQLLFRLCDELFERSLQVFVQRQASGEVLLSFAILAVQQSHESALGVGVGQMRFQFNGHGEIGFGTSQIAFGLPVSGAVEPGVGKARVELDGLVEIGERALIVPLSAKGQTAILPDEAEQLLLRAGEVVPLTPKAFDVLLMSVKQPGRLLEKETLLQAVWADSFVEEKNLADNISRLRNAPGEGENSTICRLIRTRALSKGTCWRLRQGGLNRKI